MSTRGRRESKSTRARRGRRWVRKVQATSNALDLPPGIFTRRPRAIALDLRRAAAQSHRRKGRSEWELRKVYGRPAA